MSDMRFDGKVVIVTGAGGQAPSLGRSHALLLAARGAKVVVNDFGVGPDGRGTMRANAERVVEEIRDLGGEAVADTHSVATEEGAQGVVQTAIDKWGRLDALINNAGVAHLAEFTVLSSRDVQAQIDVHLMGTIWMCRAAWPQMRKAGYGRIVNTASNGVFGGHDVAIYGASKGGIFSLSKNLAAEGLKLGIKVNILAPGAATTSTALHLQDDAFTQSMKDSASPDLVAPVAAFLAHEECPVTSKFFMAAGGRMFEYVFQSTKGYGDPKLTMELVRDNFSQVMDRAGMIDVPPPENSAYVAKAYVPG